MNSKLSLRMAQTSSGQSFFCPCRSTVHLEFMDRRFVFQQGEFSVFRKSLARLSADASLFESLLVEAKAEAFRVGSDPSTLPTLSDIGRLLDLVDVTLLVLEAQDLAGMVMGTESRRMGS